MKGKENNMIYPVLTAEVISENQVRVYCRYCKDHHYHGNSDGHRVAHCTKDTPYRTSGYIIEREEVFV